jgi:hypothetical protein
MEMSFSAARQSKLARRACEVCRDRKALFRFRGEVRADRSHLLCFECYRSERNRQRAQLLLDLRSAATAVRSSGSDPAFLRPLGSAPLTPDGITHRRRMLAHLEAARDQVARRLG